jgi:hypothetical protein
MPSWTTKRTVPNRSETPLDRLIIVMSAVQVRPSPPAKRLCRTQISRFASSHLRRKALECHSCATVVPQLRNHPSSAGSSPESEGSPTSSSTLASGLASCLKSSMPNAAARRCSANTCTGCHDWSLCGGGVSPLPTSAQQTHDAGDHKF